MSKAYRTKEQIRDELLADAYKLVLLNNLEDDILGYEEMVLHYEATIGRCRLHVAINIKDLRRDDDDDRL